MPLKTGKSQRTMTHNIRELHTGDTYARTKREQGKKAADKQAVAIALDKAGMAKKRKK